MHRRLATLCTLLLLAGCQSVEEVFTPQVCNDTFEETLRQIQDQKETVDEMRAFVEKSEREGKPDDAAAQRKTLESHRKEGIGGNIRYIEEQLIKNCDTSQIRPELLQQLEEARKLLDETEETFEVEGMPDLRVTGISSTFVPYRMDHFGRCEGPFLDLVFRVTNGGGDYPRPVDLETYSERAERPADELHYFTMVGELDFGNDMRKRIDLAISGGSGGNIPSGGSLELPASIKIDYNQTHAKATGYITTHAFLKSAEGAPTHETEIDVPIWDIYTISHQALASKDFETGKPFFGAIGTVTNKGASPTPGPIQASFVVKDGETGRYITGWTGKTDGPVSGDTPMYYREPFTGTLPKTLTVESSIIPLCPDGTTGNLADGDTKNNIRELRELGRPAASSAGTL